ncbi:hypothetical protein [Streptomyces sp. yr375]|uniref:hypothetical protein n=1 Tax=Streptomyces sp. yr375 TaxID=1761906 RepID=UPI003528E6E9
MERAKGVKKGVRRGAGHDVARLLDELYVTPPSDFVSRREELAGAAKAAGRVADARLIHAARRPTLAAWAANLLVHSRPQESRRFLELGRALREAYRTLDADGIRELSEQRRTVVSALSRQAAELARDAGHRLSGPAQQDVDATLRAVLADQDAADRWATGRLESTLTPPADFPARDAPATTAPAPAPAPAAADDAPRRSARAAATASPSRARTDDEVAERRRRRQERLDQARRAAEAADQRLRDRRAEQADAEAARQRARDRHDQAARQESDAEQRLRQARRELQQSERERSEAEERLRVTADATVRAEQAARDAAREVEREVVRSRKARP